ATTIGSLVVCDTKGTAKVLASGFGSAGGVAWTPDGKEIWFSAVRGGTAQQLLAVSRHGKERLVTRGIGSITVHDVAQDGRVLLTIGPGEPKRYPPINGDISYATFLGDGKQIIFDVTAGDSDRMYMMTLNTGKVKPALPEGVFGIVASPDGKYVVGSSVSDRSDKIYDLAGGSPRPIKGISERERVAAWGTPPLPLYVATRGGSVVNLFRLDPTT